MANVMQRNRFAVHGLIAVFSLLWWSHSACAALLKDIRVGEYDNFTRIVLELDTVAGDQQILSEKDGQLTVVFADTHPDLVRKIPFQRTKSIKDLQIRTDNDQLSVTLVFISGHQKVTSSNINDPPRLIMDVHLQPFLPAPAPNGTPDTFSRNIAAKGLRNQGAPIPILEDIALSPAEPILPHSPIVQPAEAGPPSPIHSYATPADREDKIQNRPAHSLPAAQSRNGLQYYLVIALVILTVGILIILVIMMLLSRRRREDDNAHLSPREYLKRQDDRIAALNARIQEQLERYEEA